MIGMCPSISGFLIRNVTNHRQRNVAAQVMTSVRPNLARRLAGARAVPARGRSSSGIAGEGS